MLSSYNAVGPDNIPIQILKGILTGYFHIITSIFNYFLNSGISPTIWKSAVFHPHQKLRILNTSYNVRHIIILSGLPKCLVRFVNQQLFDYLPMYSLISN